MHDPMVINLVWLLVPMVPAMAMFKWFPGDASASGPFMGLKWKLSGAVVGYFLILLISQQTFSKASDAAQKELEKKSDAALAENSETLGEMWTIKGSLLKKGGAPADEAQLYTQPPSINYNRVNKTFSLNVLLPRRKQGDSNTYSLNILCDRYQPESIHLPLEDEAAAEATIIPPTYVATRNSKDKIFVISPTIVLDPAPPSDDKP